MLDRDSKALKDASPYVGNGGITREQFLFHETRIVAKLITEGLSEGEIVKQIVAENLFQYPTNKSSRSMAMCCLARLQGLNNRNLIEAIATRPSDVGKQICLYAMMKRYRLVWDFMVLVVGEKYQFRDFSFGAIDVNSFFSRLREQDDAVAQWSDSTIDKIKQVLKKILVENGYLDNTKARNLNLVTLAPELRDAIVENRDAAALAAFNYFR